MLRHTLANMLLHHIEGAAPIYQEIDATSFDESVFSPTEQPGFG